MANTNQPFGARPVRHRNGAPYSGACTLYYIPASLAACYVGDFVAQGGSSNDVAYAGNPVGSLSTVALATSGTAVTSGSPNVILGVVVGFHAEQATSPVYNPASTARGVYVADDPDLIFEIQDSGAATLAYTDVGANFLLDVSTNSGSTATGLSGHTMGTSADTSNVGAQLKMLGLAKRPKNVVGQYGVWDVVINNHVFGKRVLGM